MESLASLTPTVIAGIGFDPTIRGILATGVGVIVLMGSIHLLLATNTGNRLGFLLALTGCFGWLAVMGMSWWIYGIGMVGQAPEWTVVEYNTDDTAQAATDPVRDLDVSLLPQTGGRPDYDFIEELAEEDADGFRAFSASFEDATGGWRVLSSANADRAEAETRVRGELPACDACQFGIDTADDFEVLGGFSIGGKDGLPHDPSRWDRISTWVRNSLTIKNPTHYLVIQVQKVIPQETEPGQAPPEPEIDESEPVISVVMVRDLGDMRFPSAMLTIGSVLMTALLCWILHQRDKQFDANVQAAQAAGAAGA